MDTVNVCAPGHYDPYDSYGLIACQLVRHLGRMGVMVNALALGDRTRGAQWDDVRAATARPLLPAWGGVLLGYPTQFHRYGALTQYGPRVAVTMFESSKPPAGWVRTLNGCSAVVVPTWFCWESFRQAGVVAPLHVVPLGIGDSYRPIERPTGRPLTFLAFVDRGKRKGGLAALEAFQAAFGDDTAVRLILKGRAGKVQFAFTNPNIEVIQQDMSEVELAALYGRCDVLINPNMGEGFGLIPREFAATGGIALATDWGGTADDLPRWGWPLPYTLVAADWQGAKNLQGQDLGVWAQPDVEGVDTVLRQVAAHREWYQAQAAARAEIVAEMYRWDRFAERVLDIWREAADGYRDTATAA